MAKFDNDGFEIIPGTITLVEDYQTYSSSGYRFTKLIIQGVSRRYTNEACDKLNQSYGDIDYFQFVDSISPINYSDNIEIVFQHYDATTYCAPRFSFSGDSIPLELLKMADKFKKNFSTPEGFICAFLKKNFVLLKEQNRQVQFKGKLSVEKLMVRDTANEAFYRSKQKNRDVVLETVS